MTVLFIVLLHAVPVFIIGAWAESKAVLTIAAVIAAAIGAATGSSTYIFADLFGVFIAYLLGISYINNQRPIIPVPSVLPASAELKKRAIRDKRFL